MTFGIFIIPAHSEGFGIRWPTRSLSSQTILCFYFDRDTDVLHIPCSQSKLGKCSIFSCLGLRVAIWTSPYLKIKSNKCSAIIKTRLRVGIMLSELWFHAQPPHRYPGVSFPWYVWSLNNSVANKVVLNVNGGSLGLMGFLSVFFNPEQYFKCYMYLYIESSTA